MEQSDDKQPIVKNIASDSISLGNISVYFVPPITTTYMQWGETGVTILFIIGLFGLITYLYVYMNINDYQMRYNIMTNGLLFGFDPQEKFRQFITDTQAEAISVALGTINTSTDTLNRAVGRMDDNSTRLTQKIAADNKTTSNAVDNLGKAIQENVGKLGGILNKLGGVLTLNSYMKDGAIKTTQLPAGSSYAGSTPTPGT
jgi:hypothetical protein